MNRYDILRLLQQHKDYGGYLNEGEFADALIDFIREQNKTEVYVKEKPE